MKASFDEIYFEYAEMVFNLALNYVRNVEDAEEITQDVFVKIHNKLNTFNANSSLKTWIYRITINTSLDVIKSRKRKERLSKIINIIGLEFKHVNLYHPGIQLENKESITKILNYIDTLPSNQKSALILKNMEGLSQKEIAKTLEITEKSLESLLYRAKKNLKSKLNEGKN